MPSIVLVYPNIKKSPCFHIARKSRPPNTTQRSCRAKIFLPRLKRGKIFDYLFCKNTFFIEGIPSFDYITEIQFMETHAVPLPSEATLEFVPRRDTDL